MNWFKKYWEWTVPAVIGACVGIGSLIYQSAQATEHYEMTQAETVKLVRSLDQALAARQQAEQLTQAYNQTMAEVRTAHKWPNDLIFDGTEWKHAPKKPEPVKPEAKPEVKK